MTILNDQSPYPMGSRFKGTPMEEVPAWYLLNLYNNWKNKKVLTGSKIHQVIVYVADNYDVLVEELNDA